MLEWDNLYPAEKQKYLDKAKKYLETEQYQGFVLKELAIFIYQNERKDL